VKDVAALPAEKQVDAVTAKLQELNPGFDGKVTPAIENGVVTGLQFFTDNVTNIAPVRALPGLKNLRCHGSSPGKGALSDLSPLEGMQLTVLNCGFLPLLDDLSPLTGMPLQELTCIGTIVAALSPLRGMPLKYLACGVTKITDLSPLQGMQLLALGLESTPVSDISPLKGLPLTHLRIHSTQVSDLSPLKGMPLEILECQNTPVADLTPLRDSPLRSLICDFKPFRDTDLLRSIRSLETINGKPVAEFWNDVEAQQAAFAVWMKEVAALPAEKQVDAVTAKLQELNHGFDGKVTPAFENGIVTGLQFCTDNVTDIAPVRALKGLRTLTCGGSPTGMGMLADLAPLTGMTLNVLHIWDTQVTDLSPLQGMPLTHLDMWNTPVSDLTPLKEMKLTGLQCGSTKIADLSPLSGMPLTGIICDFKPDRDTDILRSIKTLETINQKPVAEFWKEIDTRKAAFEAWVKDVAALPGEEQVKAVVRKLQDLNPGFDGKLENSRVENGVVTELAFVTDDITDISPVRALKNLARLSCVARGQRSKLSDVSPLRGMSLSYLNLSGSPATDLAPLAGMPLTYLVLNSCADLEDLAPVRGLALDSLLIPGTKVGDLSPLKGMPLVHLECQRTPVRDLSPLKGMELVVLDCTSTQIADLSPLQGMPLTALACGQTHVTSLAPLQGLPRLAQLNFSQTSIADLSPLKGMALGSLDCHTTRVRDLSPLSGMNLTYLSFSDTHVTDLTPLKTMSVEHLEGAFDAKRDGGILRLIKRLRTINGKTVAEFWKEFEAGKSGTKP
jgi:Leucine-rich repeat (LRR) protein